jgi:transglutaminase-like putative cysteine protease
MRIRVHHETAYRYESPAKWVRQRLRVTPRAHDGQHVVRWRVNVDCDVRLKASDDAFGNRVHVLAIDAPIESFVLHVEGEVETRDTGGVIGGVESPLPLDVFLRDTDLTAASKELCDFAEEAVSSSGDGLERLHALMGAIHGDLTYDTRATDTTTSAIDSFALRRGVCQDLSHVFIAAARHLEVPARYVSGYFVRSDGVVDQEASHAWAEAYVPDLGWVGFDPANGICVTDAHVRVAVGLDYLGAAPVRGSRYGGGEEHLAVSLHVAESMRQQ